MTQLGISLGLSPRESMERLVGLVRRAEALGVDACWVIDSQMAMKDAYIALAVLARETSTIELGPGVTQTITRHETVVANAMSTLATIAPGRINFGWGVGDSSVLPLGRKPMKIAEAEEALGRLRALVRGAAVSGPSGEYHLSFAAETPPPIYVSATQPRMLALAGAHADGVIIMGPSHPEMVRMQLDHIDAAARAAGRDPKSVRRDLWVTMSVGDGDKPVEDVKSWGSAQARLLAKATQLPESMERYRDEMVRAAETYEFGQHLSLSAGHASVISDEFAKVLAVAGTYHECFMRLGELRDLGVDRITITLLSGGREQRLKTIARLWRDLGPHPDPVSQGDGLPCCR
jgi:alkanesulfonate monooxygenase SsuD/methylene tetrahydromethanopterin reductase-like flavin-dependent oxidoreductase (luciferase family)